MQSLLGFDGVNSRYTFVRRLGNSRLSEALISEKMTWLKTWNVYNIDRLKKELCWMGVVFLPHFNFCLSLFLCLFFSLSVSVFCFFNGRIVCLSLSVSVSPSILSLSLSLSVSLFFYRRLWKTFVCLFLYVLLSLPYRLVSFCKSLCISLSISVCLSFLFLSLSVFSISLSLSLCVFLQS